jgi:signal transduction histidine kinase
MLRQHAAVCRVGIARRRRDEMRLDVADGGVGFDQAAMKSRARVDRMQERLSLVDGECLIESQPGSGTRIRARVPLRRSD